MKISPLPSSCDLLCNAVFFFVYLFRRLCLFTNKDSVNIFIVIETITGTRMSSFIVVVLVCIWFVFGLCLVEKKGTRVIVTQIEKSETIARGGWGFGRHKVWYTS